MGCGLTLTLGLAACYGNVGVFFFFWFFYYYGKPMVQGGSTYATYLVHGEQSIYVYAVVRASRGHPSIDQLVAS